MEQGNAIPLFVMLFLSAGNRYTNGSTAADNQQRKPQCGVSGVAGARGNRLHRRRRLRCRLRGHRGLRGCCFRRLCLDGELSCCRTVLRNDRKRMLTHGKRGNKITVQRDDGAALSLRIVLFIQRSAIKLYTNKIGKGCIRSEGQFLFLALRDRCTIPGCDFRGQLCRHGGSLGDFLYCRSIGEILLAAAAVPIRNVAFFGSGGSLCVNVFQVGVVVLVRAAIACLAKLTDGILGAGRFAAGVLRVAVLFRVIRHIAAFIGTLMPVMRCIGRPIGLPAVAGGIDWLRLCRAAFGAAICLFARFCAGRRCCYRTAVPKV